jgi:uncharacterized membrane protein
VTSDLRAPRWPAWVGLPLCAAGLGIAAYLTYEHYTGSKSLVCPATGGLVNCLTVTTSKYSMIHGVSVAVLGLIFFAVMAALQSPWAWASRAWAVHGARVAWSLVGLGTAVWLVYAELFRIHNICLWCTSVHVISLVIFVVTMFATAALAGSFEEDAEDDGDVGPAPA